MHVQIFKQNLCLKFIYPGKSGAKSQSHFSMMALLDRLVLTLLTGHPTVKLV